MHRSVGTLCRHRAWRHGVGIAASVQQKILALHPGKVLRVEGHADKMEVGIKAVDLDWVLDIVGGRTVTVVVGVFATAHGSGRDRWHGIGAKNIRESRNGWTCPIPRPPARRPQIVLLRQQRVIERGRGRYPVLPGTYIELPNHAHLQVLGRRDVAVPEVGAGIGRQIVIGEASTDVDRYGGIWYAVIEGRSVGIAVEVD